MNVWVLIKTSSPWVAAAPPMEAISGKGNSPIVAPERSSTRTDIGPPSISTKKNLFSVGIRPVMIFLPSGTTTVASESFAEGSGTRRILPRGAPARDSR